AGTKHVDGDATFALRIAENVTAGEHEGFAGAGVDQRSRAVGNASRIGNCEADAGGDQIVGGRSLRAGLKAARRQIAERLVDGLRVADGTERAIDHAAALVLQRRKFAARPVRRLRANDWRRAWTDPGTAEERCHFGAAHAAGLAGDF